MGFTKNAREPAHEEPWMRYEGDWMIDPAFLTWYTDQLQILVTHHLKLVSHW